MLLLPGISLMVGFLVLAPALLSDTAGTLDRSSSVFHLSQDASFTSWRPYNNPNRLVSVGMNKGQVIAIAGRPEHEESYYQSSGRRLVRISDWYYFRTGHDPETTLLKFVGENLVSITSTPTH